MSFNIFFIFLDKDSLNGELRLIDKQKSNRKYNKNENFEKRFFLWPFFFSFFHKKKWPNRPPSFQFSFFSFSLINVFYQANFETKAKKQNRIKFAYFWPSFFFLLYFPLDWIQVESLFYFF